MSLQITQQNHIEINGQNTGLGVVQRQEGTIVYTRESVASGIHYKEHPMPTARYLLGSDSAITKPGVATRAQFEADVLALLEKLA